MSRRLSPVKNSFNLFLCLTVHWARFLVVEGMGGGGGLVVDA